MKRINYMMSALAAVLAIASCNKMDTAPDAPKRLKTVEVSLENAALTKGLAGDKIESGDAVIINDLKIFFLPCQFIKGLYVRSIPTCLCT